MKTVRDIKLVIKDNEKVLETIVKETNTQPSELVTTLQEFQQSVNAVLTEMIERSGDSGDTMEVSEEEDSEDEADNAVITRKKRKK